MVSCGVGVVIGDSDIAVNSRRLPSGRHEECNYVKNTAAGFFTGPD